MNKIVCSQEYPLHQCCHKFTLEQFIVVSGGWVMEASCEWSSGFLCEQRHVNVCVHQFCTFLFERFLCCKVPFEQCHLPFSSFTYFCLQKNNQCLNDVNVFDFITEELCCFSDFHKTISGSIHV